jgi:hypothetical protein
MISILLLWFLMTWVCVNAVALVIVQKKDFGVHPTEREGKAARLLDIDLSLYLCGHHHSKAMIGDGCLRGIVVLIVGLVDFRIHGLMEVLGVKNCESRPNGLVIIVVATSLEGSTGLGLAWS